MVFVGALDAFPIYLEFYENINMLKSLEEQAYFIVMINFANIVCHQLSIDYCLRFKFIQPETCSFESSVLDKQGSSKQ